jgi:hypothetical protein
MSRASSRHQNYGKGEMLASARRAPLYVFFAMICDAGIIAATHTVFDARFTRS